MARLAALALAGVLTAASCGTFGAPPTPPDGGVAMSNATSLPIAVHVNGEWVGTYPSWTEAAGIPVARGEPPWRVSFLTPDDELVASLVAEPGGAMSARWITRCGTLVAWFGERPADAPAIDPAAPRPPGPPCT